MSDEKKTHSVAARITHFREQKGWTINKLANKAGVSQSYLRDIEISNKNPTVEFVSILCDALGISLSEFFADSEEESQQNALIEKVMSLTTEQRAALKAFLDLI